MESLSFSSEICAAYPDCSVCSCWMYHCWSRLCWKKVGGRTWNLRKTRVADWIGEWGDPMT